MSGIGISSTSNMLLGGMLGTSIDVMVIVGLAVLAFVAVLRTGTGQATALALSLPFAALLYTEVPGAFFLGPALQKINIEGAHAAVFGILFVITTFLMYRIVTCYDSLTGGSVFGILAGVSVVILLIVTWLQIPALVALHQLSAPLPEIFSETYRLYWTLVALFILAYVRS